MSVELKDSIYRLAFVVRKPVKDVCEDLIRNGLYGNKKIFEGLSIYFRRTATLGNTVYRGHLDNERVYDVTGDKNGRVSIRLTQKDHESLYNLSYVLDCSVSKTAAVLLYESITDGPFVEMYLEGYLETLDPHRKRELKHLIKYIKREIGEGYSLADLLSFLIEEPIKWQFPK